MKEITSIEKYISTIMKMKKEQDALGLNSHHWFFRGQKDSSWSIIPNAFRDDKLKNEQYLCKKILNLSGEVMSCFVFLLRWECL